MRRRVVSLALSCLLLPWLAFATSNDKAVFVDVQDSMESWLNSTIKTWELDRLPDALTEGDLFSRAQQLAELQIVRPANDALYVTHSIISDFCDGDLEMKHTTNVFANSTYARELDDMMRSRKITDEIRRFPFDVSCTEVVKCYYRDQLLEQWVNLDTYEAYSNTTFIACQEVVARTYNKALMQNSTVEIMKNNNYGDEIFVNGTLDDSPYDLLYTIEEIGDILFAHNDDASEVHYYNFEEVNTIIPGINDPRETKQHIEEEGIEKNYDQDEDDIVPEESTGSYNPPNDQPAWWITLKDDTWWGWGWGGSIQNGDQCIVPIDDNETPPDEWENAEALREFVYDRNYELLFDRLLAAKLWAMLDPKVQEDFGDDTKGLDSEAEDAAKGLLWWQGESADTLEEFEEHVRSCIDQFTEEWEAWWKKIVWKSITQPSQFTSCVLERICKEVGDPTWRGMYRVKICNVPSTRSYGTTNKQQVRSIEEIMDEIVNRCYGLRESGQLLKHNKTKDHMGHKLEKIKLVDTLAFGLTVTFKAPPRTTEPSAEKRMQIENNKYLTDLLLWFNEEMTFEDERNKYNVLVNPTFDKFLSQEKTTEWATQKTNAWSRSVSDLHLAQKREQHSQASHYVKVHEELISFVEQNTAMRLNANEFTDSMQDTWKGRAKEFGVK